jgi:hypothetical protein
LYRKEILDYGWDNIRNSWGTFLYGDIGDGPYVAHTDASQRYQTNNRTAAEDNAKLYMNSNPISDNE